MRALHCPKPSMGSLHLKCILHDGLYFMLFVFSEVQVREAIEQIKCLVPLTKHATKIVIIVFSHDFNSNLLKFLQNHPHFSFLLAEILPIPCNFGEF